MDKHSLLDEIAVVDNGSTDRTREIARKLGADVYSANDILPETGSYPGKGENLWKSLYLLKGDILVWIDSNIRNIHPKFVYGLIGPLLLNPEIGYDEVFEPILVIGKSELAVAFGALDAQLVHLVFLILSPRVSAEVHLKNSASLAVLFKTATFQGGAF